MRLRTEQERAELAEIGRLIHELYQRWQAITEKYDQKADGEQPIEPQGGNE